MTTDELIDISGQLTSDQARKLVSSLPMESETRQRLESIKRIKHVGDAIALEVLLKLIRFLDECDNGSRGTEAE